MEFLDIALAILGLVTPLLALPYALGKEPIVRRAAVGAFFIVPLVGEIGYLRWHWQGGPSVVIPGPFWSGVLLYYPLAVVSFGLWSALLTALLVRAVIGGDSNKAAAGDGGQSPVSPEARRA